MNNCILTGFPFCKYLQDIFIKTLQMLVVFYFEKTRFLINSIIFFLSFYFLSRCDNDTTILHFGNGMSSIQRFSIQAFRFLTQHRFVYIHCDLVVCNRNYPDSTCARGNSCSRRRYRRGVNNMSSSDDSSRMYALSSGPLMYSAESGGEKSTGWYCI